jgi:hypothetical protein
MGKPTFLSNLTSLPEVGGTIAYYFENFESQHKTFPKDGLADFIKRIRKCYMVSPPGIKQLKNIRSIQRGAKNLAICQVILAS